MILIFDIMLGMESNIIIGTALNKHARFYLGDTTKLVDDAGKIHDMWPTSLAALGRTMAVTSVMALMQKNEVSLLLLPSMAVVVLVLF